MNRFEENFKVIKQLKSNIELTNYSGFGGLNKVMNANDHQRLKSIVTEEEYQSIVQSFKTAYYTPKHIIDAIYLGVQQLGFSGGKILDPACGHGSFIFNMPDHIRLNSVIYAVELDRLSAKIAKAISPYAKILNRGFENFQPNNNSFDLIIGNPPYSSIKLNDHNYPQYKKLAIHHYFVAKSIELLKDGGILAMVLPQYCLDNLYDHPREIMNKNGSLISAYRLPDCMFDNAKVTVDIIFYVKSKINNTNFLNTNRIKVNNANLAINEYYLKNTHHILGNLNTCNMYGERLGLTVSANETKDKIFESLNQLIKTMPKVINSKHKQVTEEDILMSINKKICNIRDEISHYQNAFESHLLKAEIMKLEHIKSLCQQKVKQKNDLNAQMKIIDSDLAKIAETL